MSHLSENDRKTISNMLAHKATCAQIANIIGCDPTTISKEIKRNRVISKEAITDRKFICKKLERYPYVCLDCKHKYKDCTFTQLRYDSGFAQRKYEAKLHNSRKGINLTLEEHVLLNKVLHDGLLSKKSIYTIAHSNNIPVSVPTVYRYIQERKIDVSKMDLPYAVTYKKRKKANKKYEYSENTRINRSNRTFLDYLSYKKAHLNEFGSQMDFLGSVRTDSKSILVIIIPELHFPILRIIQNKNSNKVVEVFDEIERRIGFDKFAEVFPSILTDRDPSFSDINGIEYSKSDGSRRTNLFFCDAFKSNQKASVENMNKQIRKFFPKGTSVDGYTSHQVKEINHTIVESQILSLDGHSPKEAFITLFGLES